MSAFPALALGLMSVDSSWLLSKQENYNSFLLFLDWFFSGLSRMIIFSRNPGKELLCRNTVPVSLWTSSLSLLCASRLLIAPLRTVPLLTVSTHSGLFVVLRCTRHVLLWCTCCPLPWNTADTSSPLFPSERAHMSPLEWGLYRPLK